MGEVDDTVVALRQELLRTRWAQIRAERRGMVAADLSARRAYESRRAERRRARLEETVRELEQEARERDDLLEARTRQLRETEEALSAVRARLETAERRLDLLLQNPVARGVLTLRRLVRGVVADDASPNPREDDRSGLPEPEVAEDPGETPRRSTDDAGTSALPTVAVVREPVRVVRVGVLELGTPELTERCMQTVQRRTDVDDVRVVRTQDEVAALHDGTAGTHVALVTADTIVGWGWLDALRHAAAEADNDAVVAALSTRHDMLGDVPLAQVEAAARPVGERSLAAIAATDLLHPTALLTPGVVPVWAGGDAGRPLQLTGRCLVWTDPTRQDVPALTWSGSADVDARARVRGRTAQTLEVVGTDRPALPEADGSSIVWLQPGIHRAGGLVHCVALLRDLQARGWEVAVAADRRDDGEWWPTEIPLLSFDDAEQRRFDVLVLSDPDVAPEARRLRTRARRMVRFHLAAYMVYRDPDRLLADFYEQPADLELANSTWTSELVTEYSGRQVDAIVPGGVDIDLMHPRAVTPDVDVTFHDTTREMKGAMTAELATTEMLSAPIKGPHNPQELAAAMARSRVYVSTAWHEGFNLMALEAMACGAAVVISDDGGSRDYVRDGENALLTAPRADDVRAAVERALSDDALRERLVVAGMRTAGAYDWSRASHAFATAVRSLV